MERATVCGTKSSCLLAPSSTGRDDYVVAASIADGHNQNENEATLAGTALVESAATAWWYLKCTLLANVWFSSGDNCVARHGRGMTLLDVMGVGKPVVNLCFDSKASAVPAGLRPASWAVELGHREYLRSHHAMAV